MKRKELKFHFESFYNDTYSALAVDCLKQTGDFLNIEDLLAKIYYAVYIDFKKYAKYEPLMAQNSLKKATKEQLALYWKKHRKELQTPKLPQMKGTLEQMLETEFDLTEESVEDEMLTQDILEYVSGLPALLRRSFVLYFYFEETPESISTELNLPAETVKSYLLLVLKKIKKNILDEYL